MKWSGYALAAAGLAVTVWLLLHIGLQDVLHSFELVGWGILLLIVFHVLPMALDSAGWHILLRSLDRLQLVSRRFLLWVTCVREAVSRLFPVASIGGDILGCRLVMQTGLQASSTVASVTVEIWVNLLSRYVQAVAAVVILMALTGFGEVEKALAAGLLVMLPIVLLVALMLARMKIFSRLVKLLIRLIGPLSFLPDDDSAAAVDRQTRSLLQNAWLLAKAIVLQLGGMFVSSLELYIIGYLIGQPITLLDAIALEGLVEGVRYVAFFIPAGLGVQEAGFVFFGQLLGIEADVALAMSLIRRVREIGFGLPMLVTWQWREFKLARQSN